MDIFVQVLNRHDAPKLLIPHKSIAFNAKSISYPEHSDRKHMLMLYPYIRSGWPYLTLA